MRGTFCAIRSGTQASQVAWHYRICTVIQRRQVFNDLAIDLALDVGANLGQFAHDLRLCYRGELISFEPVSAVFQSLVRTACRDPHWKVYQLALGSEKSKRIINVYPGTELSSFLKTNAYCAEKFGAGAETVQREVVSVRRLDEVLEEVAPYCRGKRIFLKMDTQGYDVEVFKGLGDKLEHIFAIQSEVSLIPLYEGMPHWTFQPCGATSKPWEAICPSSWSFPTASLFPSRASAWRRKTRHLRPGSSCRPAAHA